MISYLLIDCIEQFEFEKEGERVMAGNNTYDAGSIAVLEGLEAVPVSYTHLTLPTNSRV